MPVSELLALLVPAVKWIVAGVLAVLAYCVHKSEIRRADREEDRARRLDDNHKMQVVFNQTLEAENKRFQDEQNQRIKILRSIDQSKLNPDQQRLLFTDPIRFLDVYPDSRQFEKTSPGSED